MNTGNICTKHKEHQKAAHNGAIEDEMLNGPAKSTVVVFSLQSSKPLSSVVCTVASKK